MGSCGSRTPQWRQWRSEFEPGLNPIFQVSGAPRGLVVGVVVRLALLGLLVGCAPTIKFGSPPRTDRLEMLKPGVSSTADVLLTLGEPRGHGAARLLVRPEAARTIWFYEYIEAEGRRVALKMLLVFFNQQRYDGHLWFSSAQLYEKTE